MKPAYDPDNFEHGTILAHAQCSGVDCQVTGTVCEEDADYRDLHGIREEDRADALALIADIAASCPVR